MVGAVFAVSRALEDDVAVWVLAPEEPSRPSMGCHRVVRPNPLHWRFFHTRRTTGRYGEDPALSMKELTASDAQCPGARGRVCARVPGGHEKQKPMCVGDAIRRAAIFSGLLP